MMARRSLIYLPSSLLSTAVLLALLTPLVSSTCYAPDGSVEKNPEYVPCSNDVSNPLHTICCATNRSPDRGPDICVPNGLCQVGLKKGETKKEPAYTKPQCTNSNYDEPGCLRVCGTNNLGFLTPCDSAAGNSSRRWCCGFEDTSCCSRPDAEILFADFGDELANLTSTSSSRISAATPSPFATTPSVSNPSTPASITSTPTPTTTPTTSALPAAQESSGLSTGAKAGIGIGASLGALALIACGIFLGKYLSARKAANASPYPQGVYDAGGYPRGAVTYANNAEAVHEAWVSGRRTPMAELADEKNRSEMAAEKDPLEMA